VRATSSNGDVHETATASDGSHELARTPGSSTVVPLVGNAGPPIARPATVTVGATMQQLDSGIR
jgi:hypothetical protein